MIENIECVVAPQNGISKFSQHTSRDFGFARLRKLLPDSWLHFAKISLQPRYRRRLQEVTRLQRMPRYQPTVSTVLGKPFRILDAASFIFMEREIFQQGIYSFNANGKAPRIIDGGANVGLSVLFFKNLYPASRVIAFEPDPRIFAVLLENVRSHQCGNTELFQRALWSSETTLDFASEGADGGRVSRTEDSRNTSVKTVRLRDFLTEPTDFLKLDIEGAETEVLEDCADHLGTVANLFVEYHSFISERQSLHRLLGILDRSGFRVHFHTSSHSPQPFLCRETQLGMDLQLNIFAYRS